MGAGIPMQPGDIAFKSNFATIDEKSGIVVRRRADRRFEDMGPILCAALDGAALLLLPATLYRKAGVLGQAVAWSSGIVSGQMPLKMPGMNRDE